MQSRAVRVAVLRYTRARPHPVKGGDEPATLEVDAISEVRARLRRLCADFAQWPSRAYVRRPNCTTKIQTLLAPKIDCAYTIPTPTSRQPRPRRLARCGGDFSQAATALAGVPSPPDPQKRFSPTRTLPRK